MKKSKNYQKHLEVQKFDKYILANKPVGITPLQLIHLIKAEHPEFLESKMAYAGRLDPMAEGLMITLLDEECKKRENYQNLDKQYTFEFVLGIESDTQDILGLVNAVDAKPIDNLENVLSKYNGKQVFEYPAFSSKTVNGKKLFQWAKEKRLHEISMPKKEIEIFDISLNEKRTVSKSDFKSYIEKRIKAVEGNFRQNEIIKSWNNLFNNVTRKDFEIYEVKVSCTSGTYVRTLVSKIGKDLGTGAIATKIFRTKIGEFSLL